jgi:membrane fusion protein (multidrug efflux system)
MYVTVGVVLPVSREVIAVPSTAVLFAPFGNSVFVIEDDPDNPEGKVVRQQIVKTGLNRGDFVEILEGLEGDETVVSTGAFKLVNGQKVAPDNSMSPTFSLNPEPADS